MIWGWLYSLARILGPAVAALELRGHSLPLIDANQNREPAGILRDGVLTVDLQIAEGQWHPESDHGITLSVYAFGEVGHPLQNPGPLIRVAQGTVIHVSLRNTLGIPITVHGLGVTVHGLGDPAGSALAASAAPIRIASGSATEITFKASTPGLYFYWGASGVDDLKLRHGIDSELTGAFVIDPPGASGKDEIFVMEMISELAGPQPSTGTESSWRVTTTACRDGAGLPHRRRRQLRRVLRSQRG